jgi:hypothetical protein
MSAFLNRKRKSDFIILLLAAASFASCIIISRIGNYPIQTEMLSWSTDQLPGNWTTLRDEWWFYHSMRTIAELLALALVAWTLVKKEKP